MNEPIRMHTVDVQLNRVKSERENEECSSRKMVENKVMISYMLHLFLHRLLHFAHRLGPML